MKINVVNEQRKVRVHLKGVRRVAERALLKSRGGFKTRPYKGFGGFAGCELNLLITDNHRIAMLHWKHMKIKGPTDVMAFGMREGEKIAGSRSVFGDVVLSAETAKQMARELGIGVQQEVERYAVHGILHLLGYRDDTPARARVMHQRQEEILNRVQGTGFRENCPLSPERCVP